MSLHEPQLKKIALHMMVTHEHHFQPLFRNIKRKFNGFQIWLLFSLTRLWHVHNSRFIFRYFIVNRASIWVYSKYFHFITNFLGILTIKLDHTIEISLYPNEYLYMHDTNCLENKIILWKTIYHFLQMLKFLDFTKSHAKIYNNLWPEEEYCRW